ncbi:unnamed protein product [Phyllotreta striolata]|uniref:Uncharacterized protein n=1 Tax=Phyllotreta striolata TaxID=444603 RepID=A0A9N9THE0_PHYSR|nr:unnamed protein product [Phyllotreta striolata]
MVQFKVFCFIIVLLGFLCSQSKGIVLSPEEQAIYGTNGTGIGLCDCKGCVCRTTFCIGTIYSYKYCPGGDICCKPIINFSDLFRLPIINVNNN